MTSPTPNGVSPQTVSKWFVMLVIAYLVATTGVIWNMLTTRLDALESAHTSDVLDKSEIRSDIRDLRTRIDLLLEKQGIPKPK